MTFADNMCRAAYPTPIPVSTPLTTQPQPRLHFPCHLGPARLTGPAAQLPSRCLVPQFHTKSVNDTGYNP